MRRRTVGRPAGRPALTVAKGEGNLRAMTMNGDRDVKRAEPPPQAGVEPRLRRLRFVLRVLQVRLRFLVALLIVFLIVGRWQVLRHYWDALTMPATEPFRGGVSSDTEYFCPMCPGAVSDWPSKCSVCNMPLVRRKKGGATQLPDGVVARMQLSPYRVQLAGIATSAVDYLPLTGNVVTVGTVQPFSAVDSPRDNATAQNHAVIIEAEVSQQQIPFVVAGTRAAVTSDVYLGHEPFQGEVVEVERRVSPDTHRVGIRISVDDRQHELWPGMRVRASIERPMAELEPFRSQPAGPPPLADGELRRVYTCLDHPDVLREKPGTCPEDQRHLVERPLTDLERLTWWCPMHPTVRAREPGHACDECNGMKLLPRIVAYRPQNQVLAVPESAVIDTGVQRVVYVERMPGMFEGVVVELGPRCSGYYPLISGLEPGQRIATTGAFLIDAETRLNTSVAASYFGATRRDETTIDAGQHAQHTAAGALSDEDAAAIREALAELSPADRESVERQKTCPITGLALGSMGAPLKVETGDRTLWICCEGCKKKAMELP